jgi:hypothetical protein
LPPSDITRRWLVDAAFRPIVHCLRRQLAVAVVDPSQRQLPDRAQTNCQPFLPAPACAFETISIIAVERETTMNLHTPSQQIFIVSLVFAALALIGQVVLLPFITLYGFWVAIIAYAILAVGVVTKT